MSCQINSFANIVDVDIVRRCLFPTDDLRGTEGWLNYCIISPSPTGELIAIARDKKLAILTAKWNLHTLKTDFCVTFTGLVDSTDTITAVECIPLIAQGQNSQVGPDWTCLVIGFSSGNVKFFTENFDLLISEHFHDEKVSNIICQSQQCIRPDKGHEIQSEEFYIVYPSNVCVLNGPNVIQILRNFRTELAKVQAKGDTLEPAVSQLVPKKWGFIDQNVVNDAAVVGLEMANTFDHLLTASTCGGFNTRYRAMAPHNTLVVGVGSKPYIGFHYAMEGGAQPVLSDVAKAVANKLKSALPSWLTGNRVQNPEKPPVTIIPSEPMGCRFGLCDIRRVADKIILSPNKSLAVVTDSLGRIALIDTKRGVCIRLWKGYRESECSFVQVFEENKTKHRKNSVKNQRVALFLVIYAPKKGVIEIWVMQQGPKIATFTASKNGRLLYTRHGLMGVGNVVPRTINNCSFSCVFIDPDGQIKEIVIPFHFSLSDKNSKRVRDVHLVKRLKYFLKSEDYDEEKLCYEISNTCSELKTNEIRLQCIEMLLASKYIQPRALLKAVEIVLEKLALQDDTENDVKSLSVLCSNLNLVINFFLYITGALSEKDIDNGNMNVENKNVNEECEKRSTDVNTQLLIPQKELNNLQKLLDLSTLSNERKTVRTVCFDEENKQVFPEYLFLFDLVTNENSIKLKKSISEDKLFKISEYIFGPFITVGIKDTSDFKKQAIDSKIETFDLLRFILSYWLQRSLNASIHLENEMFHLSNIIHALCQTTSLDSVCAQYNEISPFWRELRDLLVNSPKPFQALTAAILCRSVAQKLEHEIELVVSQCSTGSLEEEENTEIWEKLSKDNCQWTILIGKLEDISMLNTILDHSSVINFSFLPKLSYDKVEISLKYILQKGKGSVSELVAQWLTSGGLQPELIAALEVLTVQEVVESDQDTFSRPQSLDLEVVTPNLEKADIKLVLENEENALFFEHFNILKKHFPYSLQVSVLIANMSWEYAMAWHKNIQNFSYFESVLTCLKTIPNACLKQGLSNLIWSTHVKQLLEQASKLINKVSKLPKERLCRQDTGLSDLQLIVFLKLCTEFFDIFMEAVQQSYSCEKKSFKFEDLWENNNISLTELALQQNNINFDLIHLHSQLCLILFMIASLNIKHSKPITNLFDTVSCGLLFTDFMSSSKVPIHISDPKLSSSRTQFLTKVITASIECVRLEGDTIYSSEHVAWMAKCLCLGSVWRLDTDVLRGHQVVQLFMNGFDNLAEELLPAISDTTNIGPPLLAIAGRRLLQFIVSSPDLKEKIVTLSPILSSYLDTLSGTGDWCVQSSLDAIRMLGSHALRSHPEGHSGRRLASLLLEACLALESFDT